MQGRGRGDRETKVKMGGHETKYVLIRFGLVWYGLVWFLLTFLGGWVVGVGLVTG